MDLSKYTTIFNFHVEEKTIFLKVHTLSTRLLGSSDRFERRIDLKHDPTPGKIFLSIFFYLSEGWDCTFIDRIIVNTVYFSR